MANSKYEYVRQFEQTQSLLPKTYVVIRVDGKGFHKFTDYYKFEKPNDLKALEVMNEAALHVMKTFSDLWIAYGQSDEYSFVLRRDSELYKRRSDKISSMIVSTFSSAYTFYFQQIMNFPLVVTHLPIFDARCVCYPDLLIVKDYLAWRQVDCHINNLYNTCFWALVKSGVSKQDAEKQLSKTNSGDKNELLFSSFGINYNNIDEIFKKGTVIFKEESEASDHFESTVENDNEQVQLTKKQRKHNKNKKIDQIEEAFYSCVVSHIDIIKETFWQKSFPHI